MGECLILQTNNGTYHHTTVAVYGTGEIQELFLQHSNEVACEAHQDDNIDESRALGYCFVLEESAKS